MDDVKHSFHSFTWRQVKGNMEGASW